MIMIHKNIIGKKTGKIITLTYQVYLACRLEQDMYLSNKMCYNSYKKDNAQ